MLVEVGSEGAERDKASSFEKEGHGWRTRLLTSTDSPRAAG